MKSFRGRMIMAGVCFVVLCSVGFMYAASSGPKMAREAAVVVNEFYTRCKARDFRGARQLMTQNLQGQLSEDALIKRWELFEARNGKLARWKGVGGGLLNITGDKVNLWPRYVDFNHTVHGDKQTSGQVAMRLVPDGKTWRIERLSIQPISWIGAREK